MRIYSIFHVKKKHQAFVYGRERLLFDLIQSSNTYEHAIHPTQEISYLCEPLDMVEIELIIQQQLGNSFSGIQTKDHQIFLMNEFKGEIQIDIFPYYIAVVCVGSRMLELDLFATLSKLSDCFIGFNKDEMECGWLKPLKFHSHERR
ncbi:sporulation inhibitor of replication protein SirA [Viridibacillus sp. NPDC093762]|uniref:sporulation inhibitor of replication protein SirA n=1 Tax=Viridibacillus sp. NPDC093762 TaxID=3390720 RepID=UPI003CFC5BE6